jgi:hypothetical protein
VEAVNLNNRHLSNAEFLAYMAAALKAHAEAAKTAPGGPR